ncbi:MAG: hypothetical protein HRU21_00760 [Pseudomonadales bacterium]|nr:hypothetical protein [Pseudomonadales bacterium]
MQTFDHQIDLRLNNIEAVHSINLGALSTRKLWQLLDSHRPSLNSLIINELRARDAYAAEKVFYQPQ